MLIGNPNQFLITDRPKLKPERSLKTMNKKRKEVHVVDVFSYFLTHNDIGNCVGFVMDHIHNWIKELSEQ